MLRSQRSWRRRRPVARRRRGVPPSLKIALIESIYGVILAILTFPISLLIAELGVWSMIVWMQPESTIMNLFYLTLALVQLMFLLIPLYHKQPIRTIVAGVMAYVLWTVLVSVAGFHPVLTIFGPLPY